VEERAAGKAATVEIGAGGQNSRSAVAHSIEAARDPANLKRCTCEPRARRRSEGQRLTSFTDGEGARAAAMARRSALRIGGKGGEGTGRHRSSSLGEGGCGGALEALK
jgi:hypothetical protein